jgi:hypothetical protein
LLFVLAGFVFGVRVLMKSCLKWRPAQEVKWLLCGTNDLSWRIEEIRNSAAEDGGGYSTVFA